MFELDMSQLPSEAQDNLRALGALILSLAGDVFQHPPPTGYLPIRLYLNDGFAYAAGPTASAPGIGLE